MSSGTEPTMRALDGTVAVWLFFMLTVAISALPGCYKPIDSQQYFVRAADNDKVMEPLYTTPLYTVYFDFALGLCVVHSSHTWGQQGGGGGGTGIGISAFRCNPLKIRERARKLGLKVYEPRIRPPER